MAEVPTYCQAAVPRSWEAAPGKGGSDGPEGAPLGVGWEVHMKPLCSQSALDDSYALQIKMKYIVGINEAY